MKTSKLYLPLISALILTFASCSDKYFTSDGSTWGTTYHIVYRADRPLDDSIAAVTAAVDASLSLFNPHSLVSAINAGISDSVNADFVRVFECAARINVLSGGLFDPTIAPIAAIWGFGPNQDVAIPDDDAIAAALASVGFAECHIDSTGHIVKKTPDTAFDFSAIAKGFGVDCVADMFERNGITDYLVEIGGEVAARGLNPRNKPWRIQIDAPRSDVLHERLSVIQLGPDRSALASSGNYRNFRVDSLGNRYGHTLNPLTGRPAVTSVLAATVAAASCMEADALATACMCLEPDQALNMLQIAGAEGLLVVAQTDTTSLVLSPGFGQ